MSQAIFVQDGVSVEFTAAADLVRGQVVVVGNLVGIVAADVADTAVGNMFIEGVFSVSKINDNLATPGTKVYWNAAGNPVGGTAGTGGVTSTASTHETIGYTLNVAGAAAERVLVKLGR